MTLDIHGALVSLTRPLADYPWFSGLCKRGKRSNRAVYRSYGVSGIERDLQIFFESLFEISVCLGIASTAPVRGFIQREWAAPSRFKTQPLYRKCLSRAERFTGR